MYNLLDSLCCGKYAAVARLHRWRNIYGNSRNIVAPEAHIVCAKRNIVLCPLRNDVDLTVK